jgi:Protein of unknown function (DUF551)
MNEWISVDDRLPEINIKYLITDGVNIDVCSFVKRTPKDKPGFYLTYLKKTTYFKTLPTAPNK